MSVAELADELAPQTQSAATQPNAVATNGIRLDVIERNADMGC